MFGLQAGVNVNGIMGTSAGAYAGSLYCAGYAPDEIAQELCCIPPIHLLRPNLCFWNGFLLLDAVVDRLKKILPPTFESLDKQLAVGVVNVKGEHQLIDSGPLPEAVAASGAIPIVFAPVQIPENNLSPFRDGGVRDRTGLKIWRGRSNQTNLTRPESMPPALVHLISRSSAFSGKEDARDPTAKKVFLLHSRKSGRNFFSFGDYNKEMLETYDNIIPSIEKVQERLKQRVTA